MQQGCVQNGVQLTYCNILSVHTDINYANILLICPACPHETYFTQCWTIYSNYLHHA